jgi:hypothetical protein
MGLADVRAFLRTKPFRPFRVRTADGASYEVRYPDLTRLTPEKLTLPLPDPAIPGAWGKTTIDLKWDDVVGAEELSPPTTDPRAEAVQELLRARPFTPLRVRTTDGASYDIVYPNLSAVTRRRLIVGIPDPDSDGALAAEVVYVAWSAVAGIEPLVPEGAVA